MFSTKVLRALEKTVQAYEQAILDLETGQESLMEVARRWGEYGSVHVCRLCQSVGGTNCYLCVLQRPGQRHASPDLGCSVGPGAAATMGRLIDTLHVVMESQSRRENQRLRRELLAAFKARLAWILKRADENGIELVESEE